MLTLASLVGRKHTLQFCYGLIQIPEREVVRRSKVSIDKDSEKETLICKES